MEETTTNGDVEEKPSKEPTMIVEGTCHTQIGQPFAYRIMAELKLMELTKRHRNSI